MGIFSQKLDLLPATAELTLAADVDALSKRLDESRNSTVVAVGSGGSAVAAEYLALCRSTLGRGPTLVQTPMALTLGYFGLEGCDLWLFSAGGDNPDILAALQAGLMRSAQSITIVTAAPDSPLVEAARLSNATVVVTPRAEPKDGFLATHSLLGAVLALAKASSFLADEQNASVEERRLLEACKKCLGSDVRAAMRDRLHSSRTADALILLYDPRLAAAAVVIETSLWEAALLPVQRTDFRNFAHGRHVWLAQKGERALLLALTCRESHAAWSEIASQLPVSVHQSSLEYGGCSRFDGLLAILDALIVVEAIGDLRGVDPAKPGVGAFAPPIYESAALMNLSVQLSPPVRQKRSIVALQDDPSSQSCDLPAAHAAMIERLLSVKFGGVVLDYDGTIVGTEKRLDPPEEEMISKITELLDAGLVLGIATGRGGSAGEILRDALPKHLQSAIVMGYYNGAHITRLSEDIRDNLPASHPSIQRAVAWARSHPELFVEPNFKDSRVQATIDAHLVHSGSAFLAAFEAASFDGREQVKLVQSRHSFDLCLVEACKTKVVAAVQQELADGSAVLCIGDCGSRQGNDHAMLGLPFGISVDHVCHREHAGWSLFGSQCTGPKALLRILSALRKSEDQGFYLDRESLSLDCHEGTVYKPRTGDGERQ